MLEKIYHDKSESDLKKLLNLYSALIFLSFLIPIIIGIASQILIERVNFSFTIPFLLVLLWSLINVNFLKRKLKNKKPRINTLERLESQLTAYKVLTGIFIIALLLLFMISIYGIIIQENKAAFISLMTVAIALSAILPIQFLNMRNIKKEMETTKNK